MQHTKTLIIAIAALAFGFSMNIWGQSSSRPAASVPSGPFQISAAAIGSGNACAYVIDTRNGRVWIIRGSEPAKLIGDTSAADVPPSPPRN